MCVCVDYVCVMNMYRCICDLNYTCMCAFVLDVCLFLYIYINIYAYLYYVCIYDCVTVVLFIFL